MERSWASLKLRAVTKKRATSKSSKRVQKGSATKAGGIAYLPEASLEATREGEEVRSLDKREI